jgi:hypothetical protein
MLEMVGNKEIWFGEVGNNMPRRKKFLTDVHRGRVPETLWPYDEVGHAQDAKRELQRILGTSKRFFPYPKPVDLIARVIPITTRAGETVLDSCAGSGTTAPAVLKVNQADQGKRRFVLVQLPHDSEEDTKADFNICRQVTHPRITRVIEGYTDKTQKGKTVDVPGLGGSFTYARLGRRLFGEYRDLGDDYPAYDELAKDVFYTETSRDFDAAAVNRKTGGIGEHQGTAYYLLYTPDPEKEIALDAVWLKEVGAKEKCRKLVVYCEKLWLHRNDLLRWQEEAKRSVRPMLVPFNLR